MSVKAPTSGLLVIDHMGESAERKVPERSVSVPGSRNRIFEMILSGMLYSRHAFSGPTGSSSQIRYIVGGEKRDQEDKTGRDVRFFDPFLHPYRIRVCSGYGKAIIACSIDQSRKCVLHQSCRRYTVVCAVLYIKMSRSNHLNVLSTNLDYATVFS
jgi:hypothetical protein